MVTDEAPNRTVQRSHYRWLIHLGLLISAIAALVTLAYMDAGIGLHAAVGLVFVAFVIVHLTQRRRTVSRLVAQLARARSLVEHKVGLAGADALLAFITLNVLISGVVDWSEGVPIQIPLPRPFNTWHKLSSLILVGYLIVHIWHRSKRLRGSVIR